MSKNAKVADKEYCQKPQKPKYVTRRWCWNSKNGVSLTQSARHQFATLHVAPGQQPAVLHFIIIINGCDKPHQRAQASSHEAHSTISGVRSSQNCNKEL